MFKIRKSQIKAVLLLTAVIFISATLLSSFIIYFSPQHNLTAVSAAIVLLALIAFVISLLFYQVFTGSLIKLSQKVEKHPLMKTGNQFSDFMDDLPLGVFIKNGQSRAIYLNKYMDKIFGKSNCLNKTPYNIFDKHTADRVLEEDRRVLAGESVMVEEVLTDKNGKDRVYMTHKFCVREEDTGPLIGGISIEITRRREAEYKLRILSKAIRNSPVCVIITDPEGLIEYVNPAFVTSTGYSFAEVMGENMNIINSGKHPESFFREMWARIKSGRDWQGEILNKKKDGTLFWELVSISAVRNREGEITHFIAIKDDISKRKQVEDALLKAKEKAEESDKLKSAFLANMSHEIRTPMNAIVGLSSLLGDPELPLSEREAFSVIIKENSNLLLQLIDDIVDISKIEAGQITMRPAKCNVSSLLEDIYESFNLQVKEKDNEVNFHINEELTDRNLYTYTDPQRLRQIIINLISNALKFTEEGSVEFGCSLKSDGNILFFVKDTGIGIPHSKIDLIFDRFRQVDDSGTRHHRGAGLGLSISKSLVELLGGSIWAESEKGKGSTFFFTIPYQPVPLSETGTGYKPGFVSYPRLKGKSIMVVEDLEVNYRLIEAMLKKTGANILWAKTGKEALEIFNNTPYLSLVLLDLNMPDISGYDILVKLKEEREDLPVIIQTAYAMNGEKQRCKLAGCNSYITKPIQMEQLLAAMQQCMLQEN
jgi:PAS domain S-box-containing protein